MIQSLRVRIVLAIVISLGTIGAYWLLTPPLAQAAEYHHFADQRCLMGVPHTLNVLSNLPFILAGAAGVWFMSSPRSHRAGIFLERYERWPYWIFFIGLILTGIGSAYYHADPTNARLTWDRLPLAITFMALFTAILGERVHVAASRWLLVPLVLLGAASVFYWDYTERIGAGDLRFYLAVQFFPLLMVPILLALYPPRYSGAGDLVASLLCYGLAKILEILDHQVYAGSAFVSGHTLKHIVAGFSCLFIITMLWRRQPRVAYAETTAPVPAVNPA